jgi:hypothetical protein
MPLVHAQTRAISNNCRILNAGLLLTFTLHAACIDGVKGQKELTPHFHILLGTKLTVTLEKHQDRSLEQSGIGLILDRRSADSFI